MKVSYMREFVYLVEKLNFTTTANKFFLTQPTLSKHMQIIEDTLGLPLLTRTTHTVEITEAGKAVYDSFKSIICEYDKLSREMERLQHSLSGQLRIGALYYGIKEYVQPFVNDFKKAFPQISVIYVSCQNYQVIEMLRNGTIDIGVVARINEDEIKQFNYIPIVNETLKCMVSSNHPLAKNDGVTLEQLSNETMIYLANESTDLKIFSGKIAYKNAVDAVQIDMVPMMLEENNGFFLAMDTLKNMNNDSVRFIDIEGSNLTMEFGYVFPKNNQYNATNLFMKFIHPL